MRKYKHAGDDLTLVIKVKPKAILEGSLGFLAMNASLKKNDIILSLGLDLNDGGGYKEKALDDWNSDTKAKSRIKFRELVSNISPDANGDLISRMFGNRDDYGFSAMLGGLLNTTGKTEYQLAPKYGFIWLPQEKGANIAGSIAFTRSLWDKNFDVSYKTDGMSIRCVKNYRVKNSTCGRSVRFLAIPGLPSGTGRQDASS